MRITPSVELVNKIRLLPKPALIAIGGFGGSGKSTLAEAIQSKLPSVSVVAMDDFIVKERLLEPSWDKGSFDRDRLERQVLGPLSGGKPARYQKLIWSSNSLSDFIELPQSEIVVVEGISSYHPNISHYYDLKIWVATPIEIAKERGHARDGANENAQYWDLWAKNDLNYQEKHHPEQVADIIVING